MGIVVLLAQLWDGMVPPKGIVGWAYHLGFQARVRTQRGQEIGAEGKVNPPCSHGEPFLQS